MRKLIKCKLCNHIDKSGEVNNSVFQNTFSNKPSAKFYPIVNSWNSQYVFLCVNCFKRLNEPINPALYEPYEPIDGLDAEINIDNFQERLNHVS